MTKKKSRLCNQQPKRRRLFATAATACTSNSTTCTNTRGLKRKHILTPLKGNRGTPIKSPLQVTSL
ncbi:hypothetical protein DPMN_086565 [Dreissena polymorpha]|uniref:Uncharacterized protein n=1 Tax=Dreissena polymorpha TaxID=45954 RepID=A0A9D4QVL2_DREPO|nr:hypothetical protein DPMN_086565 [Dreissena polymorpha]